ncbi:MAG: RNA-binding protein [Cyanobacteria bacterium]|nr:RNA-binding protein [Cyanobacteriota bacterium]
MKTYKVIGNKLYLKNLGYFDANSKLIYAHKKLLEILSSYGEVKRIEIFSDKNSGLVEMSTSSQAKSAKKYLDSLDSDSKKLLAK